MPVGVIKLKNNIQFIYFITIEKRESRYILRYKNMHD